MLADLLITRHLQPRFVRGAADSTGAPIRTRGNANQDITPVEDIILITSLATKSARRAGGAGASRRGGRDGDRQRKVEGFL